MQCAKNFLDQRGAVITFQKSAWDGLRSGDDPSYTIIKAREGKLKGTFNGMPGVPLLGVPPTRLVGPSRDVLHRLLLEQGYPLQGNFGRSVKTHNRRMAKKRFKGPGK